MMYTCERSAQIHEIRAIHVDPHRRRQLQLRLPFIRLNGIIYVTDDVRKLPQRLRKSYKAIYGQPLCNDTTMIADRITDIFRLLMGRAHDNGAAIADCVAAPNGKYNNPRMF
jgi:hypothetical protein